MKIRFFALVALSGLGAAAYSQVSLAGSFTWSGNGHTYSAYRKDAGMSYQDAISYAGTVNGYLATITSQAEQDAILTGLNGVLPNVSYLGAQQPATETDPTANWAWTTGEAWSFTNWSSGEPNDFNGSASEQNLEMYANGSWNDIGDNASGYNTGFLVESTPEPGTLFTTALGVGALLSRRRAR